MSHALIWEQSDPQGQAAHRERPTDYREALRDSRAIVRLMGRTLTCLTAIAPARAAAFHAVDARRNVTYPMVLAIAPEQRAGPVIDAMRAGYRELSPFSLGAHARADTRVLGAADLGGADVFARSAYAERCLAPLDLATQTTLFLRDEVRIIGAVSLFRDFDQPPLVLAQRTLLERSHAMIQRAFALARAPVHADRMECLTDCDLTNRELEVARLAAAGATNLEIAHRLRLSLATVKTHLNRAYMKIGVRSRTQLSLLVTRGPA